jgi:hypothetical protein
VPWVLEVGGVQVEPQDAPGGHGACADDQR